MRAAAVSTSQAALASTRIAPDGPSASHRLDPRQVVGRGLPGSATFTFAVRQPEALTIACARSASTTGTVTFTSTESRTGSGHRRRRPPARRPTSGGSRPRRSPRTARTRPARPAAGERAVPDVDATEAGAQRHRVDPRLQHRPGGGGDHVRQPSSAAPLPSWVGREPGAARHLTTWPLPT